MRIAYCLARGTVSERKLTLPGSGGRVCSTDSLLQFWKRLVRSQERKDSKEQKCRSFHSKVSLNDRDATRSAGKHKIISFNFLPTSALLPQQ